MLKHDSLLVPLYVQALKGEIGWKKKMRTIILMYRFCLRPWLFERFKHYPMDMDKDMLEIFDNLMFYKKEIE